MTTNPTPPPWRYRLLLTALSPLLLLHALWQGWKSGELRLTQQRLGIGAPQRRDRPLWLHMASVGEVNAAAPLIQALQQRHPSLPIIISTVTSTGAAMAAKKLPGIEHFYLPLDFVHTTRRVLRNIHPRTLIIMETELWPQLYHQSARQHIPLLIANGRLSQRTLNRPPWVRRIYGGAVANVTRILARSERDAQHFVALGTDEEAIEVIGNIKFATPHATTEPIALARPYIVAASTHDDEELQISRAWLSSTLCNYYLLVIVPRHPNRREAILKQLQPFNANVAVRSRHEAVAEKTQIYLADTFGELPRFIAGAELVCMGGSLIARGGQNPIEAARLGKVALFGEHMENFADERDLLLEQQVGFQVDTAEALIQTITALLQAPEELQKKGQHASALVTARADVAERYADALTPYL